MSRYRSHLRLAARPCRPPSAKDQAELDALRAELLERYDFFAAERAQAEARGRTSTDPE